MSLYCYRTEISLFCQCVIRQTDEVLVCLKLHFVLYCWDLVFVNYSSAYMFTQSLTTCSLFWRQTRASRTQSPRVLQRHTEV